MPHPVIAADAFTGQRQYLWDLCYRLTGSVADADVLLHGCFHRAVEQPLPSREVDWRLQLTRSAAALAVDTLRRRKHRHYVGCWLPSPIETGNAISGPLRPDPAAGIRYDMVESGSMAFLDALEALDPRTRAALVLSDAFGMSVYEVAAVLEVTAATSRSLLQGGRRAMQAYDEEHRAPTADIQAHTANVLHEVLLDVERRDANGLEKLLALDATACFDAGGEFVAPLSRIAGAPAAARVLVKFAERTGPIQFSFRMLNGLPAALGVATTRPRWARRFVIRLELRQGLLVSELQVVMGTPKLAAIQFD